MHWHSSMDCFAVRFVQYCGSLALMRRDQCLFHNLFLTINNISLLLKYCPKRLWHKGNRQALQWTNRKYECLIVKTDKYWQSPYHRYCENAPQVQYGLSQQGRHPKPFLRGQVWLCQWFHPKKLHNNLSQVSV